jgi:hypothetical protein
VKNFLGKDKEQVGKYWGNGNLQHEKIPEKKQFTLLFIGKKSYGLQIVTRL